MKHEIVYLHRKQFTYLEELTWSGKMIGHCGMHTSNPPGNHTIWKNWSLLHYEDSDMVEHNVVIHQNWTAASIYSIKDIYVSKSIAVEVYPTIK